MLSHITMAFPVQHDTVFQTEEFFNRSASKLCAAFEFVHFGGLLSCSKPLTADATSTISHGYHQAYLRNMRFAASLLSRLLFFPRYWFWELHEIGGVRGVLGRRWTGDPRLEPLGSSKPRGLPRTPKSFYMSSGSLES